MRIERHTTIRDIETDLNLRFPFLRFEFHKPSENRSGKTAIVSSSYCPAAIPHNPLQDISICEHKSIAELKKDFKQLGIDVIIYRRAGNVWVQTKLTTDWTLEMQNAEGRMLSDQ